MGFGGYQSPKYDPVSDEVVLKLKQKENTYTHTTQQRYFTDLLNVQAAMLALATEGAVTA